MKYDERFYNLSEDMISITNEYDSELEVLREQALEILFEGFSKEIERQRELGVKATANDRLMISVLGNTPEYQIIDALYLLNANKKIEDDYYMCMFRDRDVNLDGVELAKWYNITWNYKAYFECGKKQKNIDKGKRLFISK